MGCYHPWKHGYGSNKTDVLRPLGWRCQSSHILWDNSFTSALLVRAWSFPQNLMSLHQIRSFRVWVFLAVRLSPMLNNYRKSHGGRQLLVLLRKMGLGWISSYNLRLAIGACTGFPSSCHSKAFGLSCQHSSSVLRLSEFPSTYDSSWEKSPVWGPIHPVLESLPHTQIVNHVF